MNSHNKENNEESNLHRQNRLFVCLSAASHPYFDLASSLKRLTVQNFYLGECFFRSKFCVYLV
jgi:hypothetical protein